MPFGFPFSSAQEMYDSQKGPYKLPPQGDVSVLTRPVQGKGFTLKNAMVIQPMEGCDSEPDGTPGELCRGRRGPDLDGGRGRYARGARQPLPADDHRGQH